MPSATRQPHMIQTEAIIENFTSPAARSPYGSPNAPTHTNGFTTVIAITSSKHICAASASMPASHVTGFVIASTKKHDTNVPIPAMHISFTI